MTTKAIFLLAGKPDKAIKITVKKLKKLGHHVKFCKNIKSLPVLDGDDILVVNINNVSEVNPPRLIRFREYRRGFQTPHELSFMPATLGRNGYLTTDTAQTQRLCRAASPSAGASGFALDAQSTA